VPWARRSAVSPPPSQGAAAAAAEPGAAPARRACVCERACGRGRSQPARGGGRGGAAAERPAEGVGERTDSRPRPLTHAAPGPPPGRWPSQGRGAAAGGGGGGVCAHPLAHRHTRATPQTHDTHRATAGLAKPAGRRAHPHRARAHSRAGPQRPLPGGGVRPGSRLGREVSEFLRIRPAETVGVGAERWAPRRQRGWGLERDPGRRG
jgi:hypothetical protein